MFVVKTALVPSLYTGGGLFQESAKSRSKLTKVVYVGTLRPLWAFSSLRRIFDKEYGGPDGI